MFWVLGLGLELWYTHHGWATSCRTGRLDVEQVVWSTRSVLLEGALRRHVVHSHIRLCDLCPYSFQSMLAVDCLLTVCLVLGEGSF